MEEDSSVTLQRYYALLHYTIAARMPRKGGVHVYATDNMFNNMKTIFSPHLIEMIISDNVPYSHYALGYTENMQKRTPRNGKYSLGLEEINFRTIEDSIVTISRCMAEQGGVTLNGNSI